MKILFVLPVASQPRFAKRIRKHIQEGYTVIVASFERDYFNLNTLPSDIRYLSLGSVSHGNYLKRFPKLILALFRLFTIVRSVDKVYFFAPDMFVLFSVFGNTNNFYYEIGDIRNIDNKIIGSIFDKVYKYSLIRSCGIVVTSEYFKKYFIDKYAIEPNKIGVVENKLDYSDFNLPVLSKKKITDNFTIGIIGFFRYENIFKFLVEFEKKEPNFKIALFGDGPLLPEILNYVIKNPRIQYFGQFKYPDDLPSIYDKVDLSFTMYDSNDLNVRLALPNKLYESIYFRVPIVVSEGTYLSKKVSEYNVGFSWEQNDMIGLIEYLSSKVFLDNYEVWQNSFDSVEISEILG